MDANTQGSTYHELQIRASLEMIEDCAYANCIVPIIRSLASFDFFYFGFTDFVLNFSGFPRSRFRHSLSALITLLAIQLQAPPPFIESSFPIYPQLPHFLPRPFFCPFHLLPYFLAYLDLIPIIHILSTSSFFLLNTSL